MTELRENFIINKTWDGRPVSHDGLSFTVKGLSANLGLEIQVNGPYFGAPAAPKAPIGSVGELWNYEVFEIFFLNDHNQYLEVEVAPSGHYLVLMLDGVRKPFLEGVNIVVKTEIDEEKHKWSGTIEIPLAYFPSNVKKFNAYAIHLEDPNRHYESLFPVPEGKYETPDFHKLSYFQPASFAHLLEGAKEVNHLYWKTC